VASVVSEAVVVAGKVRTGIGVAVGRVNGVTVLLPKIPKIEVGVGTDESNATAVG
jgi:hypothetical protein